jgi:hypothetical protein
LTTLRLRYQDCCLWALRSHFQVEMIPEDDKKEGAVAVAGRSRNLPPRGEGRIYGGHGQGNPCALCGDPIDSSQIEYEIEWSSAEGLQRSHFHLACYELLRSGHEV